jgi:hypothetical protein
MRTIYKNKSAQAGMVGIALGILITIIIGALVYYSIAGSIDTTSIDAKLDGTPAGNATTAANNQASTFFTLAPLLAIVVVAIVVIGYVNRIGG